jgi:hypothetical protein
MSDLSRFHRDTFHPPGSDLTPPRAPRVRKSHGKHSGHAAPPWVAQAEPVQGLTATRAPSSRLAKAAKALRKGAESASARGAAKAARATARAGRGGRGARGT